MNLSPEEEAIRIDVFWEELQSYPIDQVEEGFLWARGSLTFFPKPVEIIDHIGKEAQRRFELHGPKQIEWMAPTEEGKAAAMKAITQMRERWDKEDQEAKKKRDRLFEQRRKELKKQAKLLERRDVHGGRKEIRYRREPGPGDGG
jgi:hypothetical protein